MNNNNLPGHSNILSGHSNILSGHSNILPGHDTILNGEFYFNVMLHVFILFTILHLFFKFYIAKIITKAIANEFKHIIENVFENIDKEKLKKNIDNYKNSFNNLNNLFKNQEEIVNFLKSKYNINSIDNLINAISNENTTIDPQKLNDMSTLFANNFNLEYFINIFSKPDKYRQKINNIVLKNITFINVFLFVILILFTSIMVKSKILTFTEIKHVVLENCITFFFVGIIEILFFLNIASKFIPAPPSTIFTSLLSNLRSQVG